MPYEGVLRTANVTRLVRIPSSGLGRPLPPRTPWAPCQGSSLVWAGPAARRLSWPLRQAHPWLRPRLAPHPRGMPVVYPLCRANLGGIGPGGGASVVSLSLQQRARVSRQELRYLWVLVSLSATEWVQEVLLEGHPSWKYLEEVHTLLLDVKQGLRVSIEGVWAGRAGVCVCARMSVLGVRAAGCVCVCLKVSILGVRAAGCVCVCA